jgi:formate C-acetyltransferase
VTRIENLRNALFEDGDDKVFIERFRCLKQAYLKYKDEPYAVRHGLITNEILSGISVVVDRNDLLVGRINEVVPTDEDECLLEEIRGLPTDCVDEPDIQQYGSYPEISSKVYSSTAVNSVRPDRRGLPVPTWYSTFGHVIPDWEGLLKTGMNGTKEKAQRVLKQVTADDSESENKRQFLQGVVISCDAVSNFARRYACHIGDLIAKERDAGRRAELLRMKRVCEKVPANPAENLHEAIQSIWFLDLIMHTVLGARDYTLGRLDQYLYPYYRRDIDGGIISQQDAFELMECLFVKLNEFSGVGAHSHGRDLYKWSETMPRKMSLCVDSVQYCTIGGQTVDGQDASNALSFLVLDAIDDLRLKMPSVVVRYFKGMNRRLWLKACGISRRVNTLIFFNDEVVIPAYINCGIHPKDAIDYAQIACNHPGIPGRSCQDREHKINLPKFLELALNDGFDPMAGVQMGPHTGNAETFNTFHDLMGAFKAQMRYWIDRVIEERGDYYQRYTSNRPFSFESILMKDCVEMALDLNSPERNPPSGTGYVYHDFLGGGIATVADSLAAIKKSVYEDHRMTLVELNEVLKSNFKGNEELRLELLNRSPKYGNDDDYVDSIAAEVALFYCHEIVRQRNSQVGLCFPSIYTYHSYASHGVVTGATADGRLAGEPVSENQQAVNGMDRKGLTALLNSMQKLKPAFLFTPSGGSTITIHPSVVSGENAAHILADLFETYFESGGLQVQPNVVDVETLIDAKAHPEKHRDLVVRVTGYSAYFVTLSPENQDYIIARTVHSG